MPVRVSAISFLNPAPLLYDFEHEPAASLLRERYAVHYTTPARCAAELHAGEADLGLIPIAQLTPDLRIVPGCTIASLYEVRSILLLVRVRSTGPLPAPGSAAEAAALAGLGSIAADRASRSSAGYLQTLLRRFYNNPAPLREHAADPLAMLEQHPAALLIGDPALLAREQRPALDARFEASTGDRLLWLDLAQLWRHHTGLPWVAAVWAVRPAALAQAGLAPAALIDDLNRSREAGQAHTGELVAEWLPRLPLHPDTIRTYLTRNIHYHLDEPCWQALLLFRRLAAETGVLPALPHPELLAR